MIGGDFLFVGIPAHNEAKSIERMLQSVFRQDIWKRTPPERKQVLVCANACTDRTAEIVKKIQQSHPETRLIETTEKGKANAWNDIKRNAPAEAKVLFFADADVVIGPRALSTLRADFESMKEVQAVSASAIPTKGNPKSRIVRKINEAIIQQALKNPPQQISGTLYGIRREAAERISLPENIINEDQYLSCILEGKFYRDHNARVFYRLPQTIRDIIAEKTRIGVGFRQLQKIGVMSKQFKSQAVSQRLKSLRGLPLEQKIARFIVYGIARYGALRAKTTLRNKRFYWKQTTTSKIPRKQKK